MPNYYPGSGGPPPHNPAHYYQSKGGGLFAIGETADEAPGWPDWAPNPSLGEIASELGISEHDARNRLRFLISQNGAMPTTFSKNGLEEVFADALRHAGFTSLLDRGYQPTVPYRYANQSSLRDRPFESQEATNLRAREKFLNHIQNGELHWAIGMLRDRRFDLGPDAGKMIGPTFSAEFEGYGKKPHKLSAQFLGYEVGSDGSLSFPSEVFKLRTPNARFFNESSDLLTNPLNADAFEARTGPVRTSEELAERFLATLREADMGVDYAADLHGHIGTQHMSPIEKLRLATIYAQNQDRIYDLLPAWRREYHRQGEFSLPWPRKTVQEVIEAQQRFSRIDEPGAEMSAKSIIRTVGTLLPRRSGLRLQTPYETFENRAAPATVNPEQAYNWFKLSEAMSHGAMQGVDPGAQAWDFMREWKGLGKWMDNNPQAKWGLAAGILPTILGAAAPSQ